MLDRTEQAARHLDHERAGDFVAIAAPDAWFTYYYWLDDRRAPDFARTVDIHRKPGYDPVELFLDPAIRAPGAEGRLDAREEGGRVSLSDGRDSARRDARQGLARPAGPGERRRAAVSLASDAHIQADAIRSVDVYSVIWAHLTGQLATRQSTSVAVRPRKPRAVTSCRPPGSWPSKSRLRALAFQLTRIARVLPASKPNMPTDAGSKRSFPTA